MTRARERFIEDWYRWNQSKEREVWDRSPQSLRTPPFGLDAQGPALTEGDMTTLAVFRHTDNGPVVRMVLPNQLSFGRHRLIVKVVERMGGKTFAVPSTVLRAASIIDASIEVIDTHETGVPFRAKEALIRADVRVQQRWSSWERRYSGPDRRSTYFLSGFDRNERRLSYFFCELPPGVRPTTVAEAYEALKPESVKLAERQRIRGIRRQGDMFLIPQKRPSFDEHTFRTTDQYVHATNHRASEYAEVVMGGNTLVYVRGTLRHNPSGRRPDHKPLRLGRRWHLCVKNTVPITR